MIEKNNSGKYKLTQENESLSLSFDSLSPVSNKLSSEDRQNLSIKTNNSGATGYAGKKSNYIVEDKDYVSDNDHSSSDTNNVCINCLIPLDQRIRHRHPIYFCKQHLKVENINLEVIESYLIVAKGHEKLMKLLLINFRRVVNFLKNIFIL
jgi:hypothetical protein